MSARPMPIEEQSASQRFVSAARELFAEESEPEKRWEKMKPLLSELLADPDIKAQSASWPACDQGGLSEGGARAQNLLFYEDPDYGFVITSGPGRRQVDIGPRDRIPSLEDTTPILEETI